MSQKVEKPVLSGMRIKTRKRDEKEKYSPLSFRDAILEGLDNAGPDTEQISKFLIKSSTSLDYRRYAEPLFDILFAGGILAPGGSISEDGDPAKPFRTNHCVFSVEEDDEALIAQYNIFSRLIRQFKYLERSFDDEVKKLIMFLKGFKEEHRRKLAVMTSICLAGGIASPACLRSLFQDHLTKDGLALQFATDMFRQWLKTRDINSLAGILKKAGPEAQLMNLLPANKRTLANFVDHFMKADLKPICDYQRAQATMEVKKELQKQMEELIGTEDLVKVITIIKEYMKENQISEPEVVVMAWHALMAGVEWNKKEDVVADQALKQLKAQTLLLTALTTTDRSELALLLKIQEFCYDHQYFKVFRKMVVLLYNLEVLSEDTILKWYRGAHSAKGKSVFLQQMQKFVDWLENAEEEESGDEDEEKEAKEEKE